MKVVIIVPTYNEALNIRSLIGALEEQFCCIPHDMHILVVDDSSPDGTGRLVHAEMSKYANLHLLTGTKAGLGSAYIRGMTYAMRELRPDVVFEMDADFSHSPSDVPRLLAELENSADFIIGSRHIQGGSIPADWSLIRKLNSSVGNLVARHVAGLSKIRDCTAGFRAIRTSILRRVDFAALRVKGYAFQVALLHQAVTLGAVVREIPVDFVDRKAGESKLGPRDILEFALNAWWIRLRALQTFNRFAIVGASGTLINLGAFTILLHVGVDKLIASPVGIELSILSNFWLNNRWTFRHRRSRASTPIKGLKFNLISVLSLAISFGTFAALTEIFRQVTPQIFQLAGIVPAAIVNYFLNSYWTFRAEDRKSAAEHLPDLAAHPRSRRGGSLVGVEVDLM